MGEIIHTAAVSCFVKSCKKSEKVSKQFGENVFKSIELLPIRNQAILAPQALAIR